MWKENRFGWPLRGLIWFTVAIHTTRDFLQRSCFLNVSGEKGNSSAKAYDAANPSETIKDEKNNFASAVGCIVGCSAACSGPGETRTWLAGRLSRARYRHLARRALVSRPAREAGGLVVDRRWRMVLVSGAGLSLSRCLHSSGSCSGSCVPASTTPNVAANLVLLRSPSGLLMFLSAPAVGKPSRQLLLPPLQHRLHHLLPMALRRGK